MLTQVSYSLYHLLVDLLQFAASHLRWNFLHNNMISESWLLFSREGGRLVYWLPVIRQIYNSDLTPSHPCLTLVEDCEQVLGYVAIMCGKPWIRCWAVTPADVLLSWRENLERWSWTKLKTQNTKKQVDGAVAVVDPRLGEFKEQFMLPVGSVIPKYVGVGIHWILENLCPGYLCWRYALLSGKRGKLGWRNMATSTWQRRSWLRSRLARRRNFRDWQTSEKNRISAVGSRF